MTIYSDAEISELINQNHLLWKVVDAEFQREFLFQNFSEALAFIVQVGIISEKQNHHPHISNVYNRVTLRISTHSQKAITSKDMDWITEVDKLS